MSVEGVAAGVAAREKPRGRTTGERGRGEDDDDDVAESGFAPVLPSLARFEERSSPRMSSSERMFAMPLSWVRAGRVARRPCWISRSSFARLAMKLSFGKVDCWPT